MEVEERNVIYKDDMEAYNKWKSMSDNEKAPYVTKAKAPFTGKIDEVKKEMEDTWNEGVNRDWNVDDDFDFFAFLVFSEESKNEDVTGSLYLFCEDFIESYKKQHPEDVRLANVNTDDEKWWEYVPADVAKIPQELWKKLTDAKKAPYVTRGEDLFAEVISAIFTSSWSEHVAGEELWERKNDEEKALYFALAKHMIDAISEEEGKNQ